MRIAARLTALLAATVIANVIATAARAVPGDPTDGDNPLDAAVRPLADLNLLPDFQLTPEQKAKLHAVRTAYADDLARWRQAHADDFRRLSDQWRDLRSNRGEGRPTERWQRLGQARRELLASSPNPEDAMDRVRGLLTPEQRRRLDRGGDRVPPSDAARPFAADVLPLPADGVPTRPGLYKLRYVAPAMPGRRPFRMTLSVFLPTTYTPGGGPFPTLVFLHGAGEVGTDGNGTLVPGLGVAGDIRQRAGTPFATDFPMVVISPQCPPRGERWDQPAVLGNTLAALDFVAAKVRVDPDRTYLTGLSMGGKGTWLLAGADPDRFAAIAPIDSSTLDPDLARRLRHTAVWAINGADDIEEGRWHEDQMVAAVTAAGGDARHTVLPHRGHGTWDDFYRDPAFYRWFLTKRRLTPQQRAERSAATRPTTNVSPM